jgi:hypothetical protein
MAYSMFMVTTLLIPPTVGSGAIDGSVASRGVHAPGRGRFLR